MMWRSVVAGAVVWLVFGSVVVSDGTDDDRVVLWHLTSTGSLLDSCDAPTLNHEWTLSGMADVNTDGVPDLVWSRKSGLEGTQTEVWMMNTGCAVASVTVLPSIEDMDWTIVGVSGRTIVWRYLQ